MFMARSEYPRRFFLPYEANTFSTNVFAFANMFVL